MNIICRRRRPWKSIQDIHLSKVTKVFWLLNLFTIEKEQSKWKSNELSIFFPIELLRRVENDEAESAKELALIMFRTATLRSGFTLQESADFADSVEKLMRQTLGISEDEQVEEEEDISEEEESDSEEKSEEDSAQADDSESTNEEHDEL